MRSGLKIMKVIFLDRDGVINKYPGHYNYVTSWKEFKFLPRAKPALKKLTKSGFKIFILSNQAGVSKGIYSQKALDLITQKMLRELKKFGAQIAGVHYCTHLKEDNCACRKPKTGLIKKVISGLTEKKNAPDLSDSYFIGDSIVDVETGKAAGLKTMLLFSGRESPQNQKDWQTLPDFTARDLSEAVDIILK